MFQVVKAFTDANANSADEAGNLHVYWEGDTYPYKPYAGASTKLRLEELTADGFIKEVNADDGNDGNDDINDDDE